MLVIATFSLVCLFAEEPWPKTDLTFRGWVVASSEKSRYIVNGGQAFRIEERLHKQIEDLVDCPVEVVCRLRFRGRAAISLALIKRIARLAPPSPALDIGVERAELDREGGLQVTLLVANESTGDVRFQPNMLNVAIFDSQGILVRIGGAKGSGDSCTSQDIRASGRLLVPCESGAFSSDHGWEKGQYTVLPNYGARTLTQMPCQMGKAFTMTVSTSKAGARKDVPTSDDQIEDPQLHLRYPEYDYVHGFNEGLSAVTKHDKWGYIDVDGRVAVDLQFDMAHSFSEGIAAVRIGKRWGYIDKGGKRVIQPRFEEARDFSSGFALVKIEGRYEFLGKNGELLTNLGLDDAAAFSEGFACIKIKGRWGYIDKRGTIVIEPRFLRASSFSEGLAAAKIRGRFGYIDASGTFKIGAQYEEAYPFSKGSARVFIKSKGWHAIDKKGNILRKM